MKNTELLFALLRCQLNDETVTNEIKIEAKGNFRNLYSLAAPQGLAPLLGQTLSDQKILSNDPLSQHICNKTMHTFAMQTQQELAYAQICDCLEKNKIVFVPLKGAVIRKYYPQSWMRTSCDIDILVREEDLTKAAESLQTQLGYKQPADREYHDVTLYSPQGIILELHFSLKENNEKLDRLLSKVWDYVEGESYERLLNKDYFVYHIVAHCAYHFMSSGCGAKPLLDLWLLRHRMGYDEENVRKLCAISELEIFYDQIMTLAEVWFASNRYTPFLEQLEAYILDAGFGGSMDNAVAAGVLKKGSKKGYFLSRVFLSYEMLKEYYPVLEKHRWLMPVCQVRRWFAGLQRKRLGTVVSAIKKTTGVSQEKLQTVEKMFMRLKLS